MPVSLTCYEGLKMGSVAILTDINSGIPLDNIMSRCRNGGGSEEPRNDSSDVEMHLESLIDIDLNRDIRK
jgi:hypothetical protein